MKKEFMLGNAAIARGAYEAGVRLLAAYPGTPSTEIAENFSRYDGIYAEWAPNEKVAFEVALGASIGGARAMTCMKHVGLNVAADPLMTAAYTGVGAGLVIVVADDPGMHSSQNEQDSRFYGRFAKIPVLEPADAQEAKDFVGLAYAISEEYDTPVIIRTTTRLSHGSGVVELSDRNEVNLREYTKNIGKFVMMPAMARARHHVVEERWARLIEKASSMNENVMHYYDKKIGILASGIVFMYAREACPDASFFKLGMTNPLPIKNIIEFAKKVDKLYVLEELEPFFTDQLRAAGIDFIGKEAYSIFGELSVKAIRDIVLGPNEIEAKEDNVPIPSRPPVLCAGCPHRAVFTVLKKHKTIVVGDIGCYTLGALPPLASMDTTICMGASIGMTIGMSKVMEKKDSERLVAVIGDSTFYHSGMTGLLDAAYNDGNMVTIILDNSTTGMTGHQNHPGTGKTLLGTDTVKTDMEKLVTALGIKDLFVVDAYDIAAVEDALQKAFAVNGPAVIIAKRPCVLVERTTKGSYIVNAEECTGCLQCLRTGCPAIGKESNKAVILDTCVGCGLCAKVCKFHAISER